jgi:hypothetical protein
VYAIGGDQFLVDQTAGQVLSPLPPEYGTALSPADATSILQTQVAELQDFVAQTQARQLSAQSSLSWGMATMDEDDTPMLDGSVYSTNDLWLEIVSGSVTNATADLVIHPPWNVTNAVYDLLYSTNLAPTISWQWVLRSDPAQTNLTVPAPDTQGFYALGAPDDLTAVSSVGTNFWLMFYPMGTTNAPLSLFISSPVGATGALTVPGTGSTNIFSVAPAGVTNIDLSGIAASIVNPAYDAVANNGIHITASRPVSVYALHDEPAGRAAFTAYPTPMLGTNYCLMSCLSSVGAAFSSEFAILAAEDATTVTIAPSATADLIGDHGTNYQVSLNAGQTYQTRCINLGDDVTGTLVTSDKPVAVFAGANLAWVPSWDWLAANPLVQQQLPVPSWSTQVLALSFAVRLYGDSYRVLAAKDNTTVFANGVEEGTLQAAEFLDLILDGPVEFEATQPIQVAQFANCRMFDNLPGELGDPSEILLLPAGHYLKTNVVFTPPDEPKIEGYPTDCYPTNFLNIIVAQSAIGTTWVDGATVAATNFVAIGGSGYFGAQVSVTNGTHTVTSSQPVGVQVYGFDWADAYSYFGGAVK